MTERKRTAAVFLDVDDTLLDFHKAEAIALAKTLTAMGIEPREEILKRYSEINDSQWKLLEQGLIPREVVLVRRFEILFEELGLERSGAEARDTYEGNLAVGHYFMPGAPELLETLYRNYELYIVSNGTAVVQEGRIKSAGIAKYFKEIFISEEIGCDKPGKEFFRRCFERILDFDPKQAIIVGDRLSSDILGGINAGIKTCWFNPDRQENRTEIFPDYEIRALGELPALLKEIFV